MEANKITPRPAKIARIEIIPLIDVIFFLLATFVLFTLSLTRIQSVEVNLPFTGEKPLLPPPVNIQISGDGSLYWDHEAINLSDLPGRIISYKSQEKDPRVLISGDENAHFGATVLVLDELRKADIQKIFRGNQSSTDGQITELPSDQIFPSIVGVSLLLRTVKSGKPSLDPSERPRACHGESWATREQA